jgi:hypothetical protein
MSTICKLDPEVRRQREFRAVVLRHPPDCKDRALKIAVMFELALIHKSSRLTGRTKNALFARGLHQLSKA